MANRQYDLTGIGPNVPCAMNVWTVAWRRYLHCAGRGLVRPGLRSDPGGHGASGQGSLTLLTALKTPAPP